MRKKTKIIILLSVVVALIGVVGSYIFLNSSHEVVTFTGTVSKVGYCSVWAGGGRCTWVVDNNTVDWQTGSTLDALRNTGGIGGQLHSTQADVGKKVKVHGERIGFKHIKIYGSSTYYIESL